MHEIEIRVRGEIARDWSDSLEGMSINYNKRGETILTGPVRDQAALRGVLDMLADLGLELLSVTTTNDKQTRQSRASRKGDSVEQGANSS
jgi:hypothetical protein